MKNSFWAGPWIIWQFLFLNYAINTNTVIKILHQLLINKACRQLTPPLLPFIRYGNNWSYSSWYGNDMIEKPSFIPWIPLITPLVYFLPPDVSPSCFRLHPFTKTQSLKHLSSFTKFQSESHLTSTTITRLQIISSHSKKFILFFSLNPN